MKVSPRALAAFALSVCIAICNTSAAMGAAPDANSPQRLEQFRRRVSHIIVIYQENWSFDGLYGKFPGADGLADAGKAATQLDKQGVPYKTLPRPIGLVKKGPKGTVDGRFPADLPNGPFDLARFVRPEDRTGDLIHRFYHEQLQIDGGKMDRYVAWTDAAGLTMSYYDATDLPEGKLARQYTLCDHFFHAAFGGSFLNHIWLIAAASPKYPDAPRGMYSDPDPAHLKDAQLTPDGYAVNTMLSVNLPHYHDKNGKDTSAAKPDQLLPNQTMPTIGDRLSEQHISWAWYAGGWDRAMAGDPDPKFNGLFEIHHQPFIYFANYADGTAVKREHLKDEKDMMAALAGTSLPSVVFFKPFGEDDEHPGYASLMRGQQHVAELVAAIKKSQYWDDSVVIVTYDENGGRWDHVAPPKKDRWGPGTRVPTIVISPFARQGYVDHTEYDTTSILRLIEERWNLEPLSDRDRDAGDMLNALGAM
ncbi:MAG TPA: alkaline phosphatase family protein [Pirellulales bacterium]|jgi:phospholipase C|nr:alkaline phosphatase family protein [Pirellulales bacterium]